MKTMDEHEINEATNAAAFAIETATVEENREMTDGEKAVLRHLENLPGTVETLKAVKVALSQGSRDQLIALVPQIDKVILPAKGS